MKAWTRVHFFPANPTEPVVEVRLFSDGRLQPDLRIGGLSDDGDITVSFDELGVDPLDAIVTFGQRIIDAANKARAEQIAADVKRLDVAIADTQIEVKDVAALSELIEEVQSRR